MALELFLIEHLVAKEKAIVNATVVSFYGKRTLSSVLLGRTSRSASDSDSHVWPLEIFESYLDDLHGSNLNYHGRTKQISPSG